MLIAQIKIYEILQRASVRAQIVVAGHGLFVCKRMKTHPKCAWPNPTELWEPIFGESIAKFAIKS